MLPYTFIDSYLIEFGVCYLCLCDRSYPRKLAFAYLEELQQEFQEKYGDQVGTVARPYAFVKFGTRRHKLDASEKGLSLCQNRHTYTKSKETVQGQSNAAKPE